MRRLLRPALVLALVLAGLGSGRRMPAAAAGDDASDRIEILGQGRPWATPVTLRSGPAAGPTVMIVGGQHGNEPAGAEAAEQIRHWRLKRGRLIVVPRANVRALAAGKRYTPRVERGVRNLNRNFPRLEEDAERHADGRVPVTDPPRGEVAPALWGLVETSRPDWLLDLHEGFAPHRVNAKSCGHSVIVHPDQEDAQAAARLLIEAASATIPEAAGRFVRLEQVTRSTLARSAADHLGTRTLILETCYAKCPLSLRTRRHRVMVFALLQRLDMLAPEVEVDTVLPAERREGELRVAVYDAEGTGGPGVPRALAQIGGVPGAKIVRVCPEDVRGGVLDAFDVVTFTGGSGSRQGRALGARGRERVRGFVRAGGGFVGVCAGAYLALADFDWSLGLLDAAVVSPRWRRGRGTIPLTLTCAGRDALGLGAEPVKVRYANGPVFAPFGSDEIPDYEVWARYDGEVAENGTPGGVMEGSPAIAAGSFGAGRVVVIGPHPEQTKGLESVLPRAVRWAAAHDTAREEPAPVR